MVSVLCVTTSLAGDRTALFETEPTSQMAKLPPDTRSTTKGQFAKSVGAFVPKVTAAVFQKFGFHNAEIMASWETIVGPELARLTRPEAIKWPRGAKVQGEADDDGRNAGATLIVATDPAFALDVSYRHKEIIDRINRYFGYRAIGQVKVHQVPFTKAAPAKAPAAPVPAESPVSGTPCDLASALDALGRSVAAANAR